MKQPPIFDACVAPYLYAFPMDRMIQGLEQWMDGRGYSTVEDFRGTMSDRTNGEPGAFARAQYVNLLAAQNG